MKYDILVQIFTSVHPILSVYIFTGSKKQYLPKKIRLYLHKNFKIFFVKIRFRLLAWTTKPLGGGVKSLVVRPLKKTLFLCVSSLRVRDGALSPADAQTGQNVYTYYVFCKIVQQNTYFPLQNILNFFFQNTILVADIGKPPPPPFKDICNY